MPSDTTADTDAEIETEDGEAPAKKKMSGKKIVMIAGPIVLLLLAAQALYFLGILDPLLGAEEEEMMEDEPIVMEPLPAGFFHDLPNLIVNLKSDGRKPHFLKLSISLELETEEDVIAIDMVMPRIIDNFQIYLRELQMEDLQGSQGLHRLREELLRRVTAAAAPTVVRDVLFREMLIQ